MTKNPIFDKIESFIDEKEPFLSKNIEKVSGGDINDAYQIMGNSKSFFVKINSLTNYPQMFQKEAQGLEALKQSKRFLIPEVVGIVENEEGSALILTWIEPKSPLGNFWEKFGNALAELHKCSNESFGLDHDNYIGSLTQVNSLKSSWSDFFIENRLQVQLKLAVDSGKMSGREIRLFERFYKELPSLFPMEKPALLHGDLWSGNFMCNEENDPVLIDPAVYYGHREMDIAMTKLFGGFDSSMYRHYNQVFPLEKGWESRVQFANLYPLMVHVNLFGGGYIDEVNTILSDF